MSKGSFRVGVEKNIGRAVQGTEFVLYTLPKPEKEHASTMELTLARYLVFSI